MITDESLVCPQCKHGLSIQAMQESNGQILEGLLVCQKHHWYPIIGGIPRMLTGELRDNYWDFYNRHASAWPGDYSGPENAGTLGVESHGSQTKKSFGEKWSQNATWGINGASARFMRKWTLAKYGWDSEAGFDSYIRTKKRILDVGAGLARDTIRFSRANPEALVVGLELSRAIDSASEHCADIDNLELVQGSIMNPPFADQSFDLVYSEGVLHHTPDTKQAFVNCVRLLRPGGEVAVYLYRKKAPIREFVDDLLREHICIMPYEEAWEAVKGITELGKKLTEVDAEIELKKGIPELHIEPGRHNLQRLLYYSVMKMFWNDELSFEENNLVNFDWYHPAYAWRHEPEEMKNWCDELDLDIAWFHEEEAGVAFRAAKSV